MKIRAAHHGHDSCGAGRPQQCLISVAVVIVSRSRDGRMKHIKPSGQVRARLTPHTAGRKGGRRAVDRTRVMEISEAPSWSGSSRDGSLVSETRRNSEEATCQPSPPELRDSLREPPRGSDELGAGRRGTRERHARKSSQNRRGATAL
ncbi:unnamed protein product [Arctogadus glacialis]